LHTKKIVAVAAAFLFIFSLPQVMADEEIEIKISGGIGYLCEVYNPGIDDLTANMTVKLLFRDIDVAEGEWGCIPYAWTGFGQTVLGLSFISVTCNAEDKTLTRNGILIGIFVIFFT